MLIESRCLEGEVQLSLTGSRWAVGRDAFTGSAGGLYSQLRLVRKLNNEVKW